MRFNPLPELRELVKEMPAIQVEHRSRVNAIGASHLRHKEMDRRTTKAEASKEQVRKAALTDSESNELLSVFGDIIRNHTKVDMTYIKKYIRDHETSSLMPGVKWAELELLGTSEWEMMYSETMKVYDRWIDGELQGQSLASPMNVGIRARSPGLTADDILAGEVSGSVDRSRIVMFHPAFSMMNAFIPNKVEMYSYLMREAAKIIHPSCEVHSPLVTGGEIYAKAIDWFNDYEFGPHDGVNWEVAAAELLGPAFHPMALTIDGHRVEASGRWDTSAINTVSTMLVGERTGVFQKAEVAALLGDDCNAWGARKPVVNTPSLMEHQEKDDQVGFLLGLAYKLGDNPRLCGVKLSVDNAQKMIPYSLTGGITHVEGRSRHSEQERSTWIGAYKGYLGDRTMVEALSKVKAERYKGPGMLIQELMEEETDEHTRSEGAHR
jgi:hypothetical protein